MKVFHCDSCDQLVFFESVQCLSCGLGLGFATDQGRMVALEPQGDDRWSTIPDSEGRSFAYRMCRNYQQEKVCNWLVSETDSSEYCTSCRLTRVVPDVQIAEHRNAWGRLEAAKRRLIHQLLQLKLPVVGQDESPETGLAFEFPAEQPNGPSVITGHANGIITISIAEADDAEREQRRQMFQEPYRTLLGHFRHEVGHYYWDRLIRDTDRLQGFREIFGDEREDYAASIERHYSVGVPADWPKRFVSAYASSHAWEDWAETWAHYLHITDTLETARDCGLMLRPRRSHEPVLTPPSVIEPTLIPFSKLMNDWFSLTYILNNLNRGMGLPDGYPFVLSTAAIEKLQFAHSIVA